MSYNVFKDEVVRSLQRPDLLDWLDSIGFFTAPASRNHHGNWSGGLFDHSYAVTEILWRSNLQWSRRDSPLIVGMFHDLCKVDGFTEFQGHGSRSVEILKTQLEITDEEAACIRWHMGAYEGSEVWDDLGKAIKIYPNILEAHKSDMFAAIVFGK